MQTLIKMNKLETKQEEQNTDTNNPSIHMI